MASASISREERIGLGIAAAAHIAVVAVLLVQDAPAPVVEEPERIVVSLADDVGLTSTSPNPVDSARMAEAPIFSELPLPPMMQPPPIPQPRSVPDAQPSVSPRTTTTTTTRRTPTPRPTAAPTPTPRPTSRATSSPNRGGSRRVGSDFLGGSGASETGSEGSPGATVGPREQAAIGAAIKRQLRPHWQAPQGVDAELLSTTVRFRLNRDGSLSGAPSCVGQSGVNDNNAPQKDVHCERAVRAVRAASPFNLPEQFYDGWKTVTSTFDRRL